jgi:hypothetical protein
MQINSMFTSTGVGPGVSAHIRKRRDNDLIVVKKGGAAAALKHALQMRFGSGEVLLASSKQ